MILLIMDFCDAHVHLNDINSLVNYQKKNDVKKIASCAFYPKDMKEQLNLMDFVNKDFGKDFGVEIKNIFGLHPWYLDNDNYELFEKIFLNNSDKIHGIGEIGLDLYTNELKNNLSKQIEFWNRQLELAIKFEKPVVVHFRKAINYIFQDCVKLKKLPGVVFHDFAGTFQEADSILKKGVNGYFSFGGSLLKGRKKSIECVLKLPIDKILVESDEPFQNVLLVDVYKKIVEIKNIDFENLCRSISLNFSKIF